MTNFRKKISSRIKKADGEWTGTNTQKSPMSMNDDKLSMKPSTEELLKNFIKLTNSEGYKNKKSGEIVYLHNNTWRVDRKDGSKGSLGNGQDMYRFEHLNDALFDIERRANEENMNAENINIKKPLMYEQKFFAQGDDANEYMDILENKGASYLIRYLADAGAFESEGEMDTKPHYGTNDHIKKFKDGWIVSWNSGIPYIGIELVHEGNNPDAWVSPEEAESAEKMKEHNRILGGSTKNKNIKLSQLDMSNEEPKENQKKSDSQHLEVIEELADAADYILDIRENVIDHTISDTTDEKVKEEAENDRKIEGNTNFRKKIQAEVGFDFKEMTKNKSLRELWHMENDLIEKIKDLKLNHGDPREIEKLDEEREFLVGIRRSENEKAYYRKINRFFGNTNFRKKIQARVKKAKSGSGQKFIEDKEVVVDGIPYSVDATVSYGSDYEPAEGDGWNEPHHDAFFSVGINLEGVKVFDENGEMLNPNPEFINKVRAEFMSKYEREIEEKISEELGRQARDYYEEPPERDDF